MVVVYQVEVVIVLLPLMLQDRCSTFCSWIYIYLYTITTKVFIFDSNHNDQFNSRLCQWYICFFCRGPSFQFPVLCVLFCLSAICVLCPVLLVSQDFPFSVFSSGFSKLQMTQQLVFLIGELQYVVLELVIQFMICQMFLCKYKSSIKIFLLCPQLYFFGFN